MSARAEIDSLGFARSGERASGSIPLGELARIHDLLASQEGEVRWELDGGSQAGRPILKLRVAGVLVLQCQRCLTPFSYELHVECVMPIARNEAELARWESDDPLLDALVADPHMVVRDLVEDEILLSLPASLRHPDGQCGQVAGV